MNGMDSRHEIILAVYSCKIINFNVVPYSECDHTCMTYVSSTFNAFTYFHTVYMHDSSRAKFVAVPNSEMSKICMC